MTPAPIHLAGERLMLDPWGALFWPAERLLAVADLHFEKASSAAARGSLLPPWDTHATLDRLAALMRRYTPRVVVALGDSFHDRARLGRLQPHDAARLAALIAAAEHIRLGAGQPRPAPAAGVGGRAVPRSGRPARCCSATRRRARAGQRRDQRPLPPQGAGADARRHGDAAPASSPTGGG